MLFCFRINAAVVLLFTVIICSFTLRTSWGLLGPGYKTVYSCEGSQLRLLCDEGYKINLIRANFGRFSISICNDHGNLDWSVSCMSQGSFKVIQEACANKRTCTLPASSGYFGDPCPGTYKYLEAHYSCSPDSSQQTRPHHQLPSGGSDARPPHSHRIGPTFGEGHFGNGRGGQANTPPPIVIPGQHNHHPHHTAADSSTSAVRNLMLPGSAGAAKNNLSEQVLDNNQESSGRSGGLGVRTGATAAAAEQNKEGSVAAAAAGPTLGRPKGTASSPTTITIVSEEKEIYVRHPWPRREPPPQQANENQMRSISSTEIPKPNNGATSSSNSAPTSSTGISQFLDSVVLGEPNPSSSSSGSLLHNHCPPTYSGGLYWNWTRVGEMSFLPCPAGAKGTVRWFCSLNSPSASSAGPDGQLLVQQEPTTEWIPAQRPDFSDCSSLWVTNIVDRINKGESFVNLANELAEITREDRPNRIFFGGDLFRAVDIINQLVIRMEEAFELFSDDRQKNQLAKELLQSIQDTASNMLEDNNREAWFELPPIERKGAASSLMYAMERNVLLLAETKNIPSDFVRAHNNIYMSIHVRESSPGASPGTSAYSHRQGLELPVIVGENGDGSGKDKEANLNSDDDGGISGGQREREEREQRQREQFPETSVYLLPQTLVDFSHAGLTKVVLLMFKKLDRLLQPEDMPPFISGVGGPDESSSSGTRRRPRTIINSDIVTVLMGKDRFNSLSLEGPGILINFKHKVDASNNLTNARCAYWNANQRSWETNGCSLKKTDSQHTICECNHLTSFALLMDIDDLLGEENSSFAQQKSLSQLSAVIGVGSALAAVCFALTLACLVFPGVGAKHRHGDGLMKPMARVELEVKKNLTLCLLVIELIFLLGINQTSSRLLCGVLAAFLHFFFLSLFIWLFFDGFTLYLAVISGRSDGNSGEVSGEPTTSRPSKWYYILSYGVPMVILTISALIDPSSYGTNYHCWLRSDNYFVLSFVGPMIAIVSANFLFLAITVCIICRNCLTALFPTTARENLDHLRDVTLAANNAGQQSFVKYNLLKNRMRESALLLFIVSLTWSLGVIYLNQSFADTTGMGRGEDVLFRNASYTFAIFNPIQGVMVLVLFCFTRSTTRDRCTELLKSISCLSKCLHRMASEAPSESDRDSSKDGGSMQCEHEHEGGKDDLVVPRPMIPPPMANYALNHHAAGLMTAKCYLPDGRMSEYGFRTQSNLRLRPTQQLQQCNQLYAPSARLVHSQASNFYGQKDGSQQFPQVIEHVYECIDEDPYVAQLLLHNPHHLSQQQLNQLQGELQGLSSNPNCPTTSSSGHHLQPQLGVSAALPAIIRDNTTHSIIVCRSRAVNNGATAGVHQHHNQQNSLLHRNHNQQQSRSASQHDLKSQQLAHEQMLINMHESTLI